MRSILSLSLVMALAGAVSLFAADAAVPHTDELAEAGYAGIYEQPVELTAGRWEGEPFVPGGASRPTVALLPDLRLAGDLDGDGEEEMVALLLESSGGSGNFRYLAVMARRGGELVNVGTALVGDRAQVRSATIEGGRIVLDVVQPGPEDAACCPSQKASRRWALTGDGLEELAPEVTGTLSLADLAGPEWVLAELARDEPAPEEPEVTLNYGEERFVGSAGCNRYFVGIKGGQMPGEVVLGPIGSSRMACAEAAMELESRYLRALAGVTRFGFRDGRLSLDFQDGERSGALSFAAREVEHPD